MFSDYIRDNADIWFNWSRSVDLPVERMDDLILVTGCTIVNSWAAAVFDDYNADAQVSLGSKMLNNGGASFVWSNIRGTVEYHDSQLDPVCSLHSFTRGALTLLFLFRKDWQCIHTSESMRLYQGIPSKTRPLLDQTNASCSRTRQRRQR